MKIAIETQYMENYGAHDWDGKGECPQYWKMKGGDTVILEVPGFRFNDEFAQKKAQMIIDSIRDKIEHNSYYSKEYIISWDFVEDNYVTEFEKSQLEFDGEVTFPAKRVCYDELVKEAA